MNDMTGYYPAHYAMHRCSRADIHTVMIKQPLCCSYSSIWTTVTGAGDLPDSAYEFSIEAALSQCLWTDNTMDSLFNPFMPRNLPDRCKAVLTFNNF